MASSNYWPSSEYGKQFRTTAGSFQRLRRLVEGIVQDPVRWARVKFFLVDHLLELEQRRLDWNPEKLERAYAEAHIKAQAENIPSLANEEVRAWLLHTGTRSPRLEELRKHIYDYTHKRPAAVPKFEEIPVVKDKWPAGVPAPVDIRVASRFNRTEVWTKALQTLEEKPEEEIPATLRGDQVARLGDNLISSFHWWITQVPRQLESPPAMPELTRLRSVDQNLFIEMNLVPALNEVKQQIEWVQDQYAEGSQRSEYAQVLSARLTGIAQALTSRLEDRNDSSAPAIHLQTAMRRIEHMQNLSLLLSKDFESTQGRLESLSDRLNNLHQLYTHLSELRSGPTSAVESAQALVEKLTEKHSCAEALNPRVVTF